jgi:Ni/Co efflux regulator RcnB
MKKTLTAILLTAVMAGGLFLASQTVLAQEEQTSLIERLAQRFGLNQAEVENEFEQFRQEGGSRRGRQIKGDLDQAVADGVISAEQKQALETKRQEWQAEREAHQEEMRAWMEENGFDCQALSQYRSGVGVGQSRRGLIKD